jgi:hypothetical protein
MKPEHQDQIRKLLEDPQEQSQFLSKCAEFLDYVCGDCQGLSPGLSFFQQSAFGLRHMGEQMPRFKTLFDDAATVYDTLESKAPGAMYPRGSQMFTDLEKVGTIQSALYDAGESLEG